MERIFHIPMAPEIASALERRARSAGLTSEQLLQRVIQVLARPVVRTRRKYQRAARDHMCNAPDGVPEDPIERDAQELATIRRLAGLLKRGP